jgi:hypothetical protein
MPADESRSLSAQVILRDPEAAAALAEFFASAGFATHPLVGSSFAISGSPAGFEAIFGGTAWSSGDAEKPAELPLSALPEKLVPAVEAIAIPGPPDFGPTSP